jgi:hypothetical protein
MMTPSREKRLSSKCLTYNAHLYFVMDEIPSVHVICFSRGYILESKLAPHLGRQKKMESVNHASGLICSLDTQSFLLRDQFFLFSFVTCLGRTAFPFIFFCMLFRAARMFCMVGSHSLKCLSFLSSKTLCVSRSYMIMSCASLRYLFSQDTFPSHPCDVDNSRVFAANYCLDSLFSWYNSAIASCACFSFYDGSRKYALLVSILLLLPHLS